MNDLPNDIARCQGVNYEGEWREGCEHCLRRTTGNSDPDMVLYMEPPKIIAFWCECLIDENNIK